VKVYVVEVDVAAAPTTFAVTVVVTTRGELLVKFVVVGVPEM